MARTRNAFSLSAATLLPKVRNVFESVPDHRQAAKSDISLTDAWMSGLAVFALKFPSLLKFDEQREEVHIRQNLERLYGVQRAPCDTQLREILDPVKPQAIYPAYHEIFKCAERADALEQFRFLGGFLVSLDGTGQFSSSSVSCPDCAIKTSRNGDVLYYHQLLAAAIVHPDRRQVIPLVPEAILRADGETKNGFDHRSGQGQVLRLVKILRESSRTLEISYPWKCKLTEGEGRCSKALPGLTLA